MVCFPNCKINLGLNIVARRPDGYHDIETVMVPVTWSDILEIVPSRSEAPLTLTCSGRSVACAPDDNLVMRALRKLAERVPLPPLDLYLHKIIPDGAGLGGGSADAARALVAANEMLALGLPDAELAEIAPAVGADCPFFVYNRPMLATGIGTTLTPIDISLSGYKLLIVKPQVSVPTKVAYSRVTPAKPAVDLLEALSAPIGTWRDTVKNDFEPSVFAAYPEIADIKRALYDAGAVYASMSGSGSAVFGIFQGDNLADGERLALNMCYTLKECEMLTV